MPQLYVLYDLCKPWWWGYSTAMRGGATQLLLGGGAAQLIKAENSPKPVTVKAEIKIKIDSGAMANSVAHDNCTPILRGLTPF